MFHFFKIFTLLFFLFNAPLYAAQESEETAFIKFSAGLETLENKLKNNEINIAGFDEQTAYLYQITSKLQASKQENERIARGLQKQLDAMGEEPKDGTQELSIIAQKRKELNNSLSLARSRIAEAEVLLVRIDELNLAFLNARNQTVLGKLLTKQDVLIQPKNFLAGVKVLIAFFWDIATSPVDWFKSLDQETQSHVLNYILPALFLLIGTFWIGFMLRRLIMRSFGYRTDIDNPRYGQKILAAIAVAIGYGVIPSTIIGGFLAWIVGLEIFNDSFFGKVITSTLFYLLYVFLAEALARVTFAPWNEKWRLINVKTPKAIGIVYALYVAIVMIGAISLLEHIAITEGYSPVLTNFLMMISSAFKAFSVALLITRIFADNDAEQSVGTSQTGTSLNEDDDDDAQFSTSFKIIFLTFFIAFITFSLSLFGYILLSSFILNRIVMTAVLLGLLIIVNKLSAEMLKRLLLLGFWSKTFRLRRKLIKKVNFGLSLFVTPIISLLFIFATLNVWGLSGTFILHIARKLLFGFKVGGVSISLIAIVLGVAVFFASLALVKYLKNKLMQGVFSQLDIDDDIKHSLLSGMSFLGFVLSSLLAIVVMGGDLTSLAVIAGALSVGIGFGLQNIINNFVSGIIILFERPFKIGDWVILNGQEGQIKQINIRSTELETFSKQSVIIPNATLIASSMTNLTHGNNWTRQAVKVGVAYGSDVNKVTEILLECARSNKKVLKVPAPYVLFQDFGASSLDFELRCYSNNIWSGWSIPSELRYEINRRFAEEGIEIPFPQVVLHNGDTFLEQNVQSLKEKIKTK